MSKTEKIYKFINGDKFWYLVIMIATFIGGMLYYGNVNADSPEYFQYKYHVGVVHDRQVYEFKTQTGTVCVTMMHRGGYPVSVSCDFSGNSHAKP